MRKIALGLFIAMLLVLVSMPGCASGGQKPSAALVVEKTPSVSIDIDNTSLSVAQVDVTDETGVFIRHIQVGPLRSAQLVISRADIHTGLIVLTAHIGGGQFRSEPWPVVIFDFLTLYLTDQLVFSRVTGQHGRHA